LISTLVREENLVPMKPGARGKLLLFIVPHIQTKITPSLQFSYYFVRNASNGSQIVPLFKLDSWCQMLYRNCKNDTLTLFSLLTFL
jgi:hypothetical protein